MAEEVGRSGVLWSHPESARADGNLLVMLHGATSSERDPFERLVPLLPADLIVAAPRGPVAEGNGYSWVSPEIRARASTDREVAEVGNQIAGSVLTWLDGLSRFRSLGILGASQGACVAFQMLRAQPYRINYAVNLSGYCLPGTEAGDLELQRTRPPVFWGRGDVDEVIPVDYVRRTSIWLSHHSALTERTYPMGHELATEELEDAAAFILEHVTACP
jgi:phospholipase/carboxylesterase